MSSEKNPIDDLFRSSLKDCGISPPSGVWEAVSAGLTPSTTPTFFAVAVKSIWSWVVLSGVVFGGIAVYMSADSKEKTMVETSKGEQLPAIENSPVARPKVSVAVDKVLGNENTLGNQAKQIQSAPKSISASVDQDKLATTAVASATSSPVEVSDGSPLPRKNAQRLHLEDQKMVNTEPCGRNLKVNAAVGKTDNSCTFTIAGVTQGAYCSWNYGNGETGLGNPSRCVYSDENAEYNVKVMVFRSANCIDSGGCKVVFQQRNPGLSIPDVFTPNGDGINDELVITLPEIIQFNQIITDRNGRQVFVSNNPLQRWNGKCATVDCLPGTYRVFITYKTPGSKSTLVYSKSIILNR